MTTTIEAAIAEHLQSGDLARATEEAVRGVAERPQDARLRGLLIDCLVLGGDLQRADKQAELAATLHPELAVGLGILRAELRGLFARQKWFEDGAVPQFPDGPTAADGEALRLGIAVREGDGLAAGRTLEALENARGTIPMMVDGQPVDDFRDVDDRTPHALEVITTGGAYLWLDFSRLESLVLEPVKRPRELALRRARLTMVQGDGADVLIPATYHPPQGHTPTAGERLGHETDFVAMTEGGPTFAKGQRCFLAGDEMRALSTMTRLERVADG